MGFAYGHDCPFEVFITNLGKYNEGELAGEWVKFPTTPEKIIEVFTRIGIGSTDEFGCPYEEWFITDYDCYVNGLYDTAGEYESLDELNYLAEKFMSMSESEFAEYQAISETGEHTSTIAELINLTENLDCFTILPEVKTERDLGWYYLQETGILEEKSLGEWENYLDYAAFGRDMALQEGGTFTPYGYVLSDQSGFVAIYDGRNVPEEYQVMRKKLEQKKSIRKQLNELASERSTVTIRYKSKEELAL